MEEPKRAIYRSGEDMMISSLLVADWLVAVVRHYKFQNSNHNPAKIVMYVPKDFGGIPIEILQEATCPNIVGSSEAANLSVKGRYNREGTNDHLNRPQRTARDNKPAKPIRAVPSPEPESNEEE